MSNLNRIEAIAKALGSLKNHVVFVGGAIAEAYAADPFVTEPRVTHDVDCITHLASRNAFWKFEEEMRKKGFTNDSSPGAPICRWLKDGEVVDLMPDDQNILGFSNPWYSEGILNAIDYRLPQGTLIQILSPVYYLATKIEALKDRGGKDWRGAKDFEDLVYVLNYHNSILSEIKQVTPRLQAFISEEFKAILQRINLREEISTALPFNESQRVGYVLNVMRKLSN